MNLNIINFLFLFGMLQCLIMIILIIKNRKWRSNENTILLSLLLILLASLIPPFLGNSKVVDNYDFLRFIPLHLTLFVFPLLYLYVKSIFSSSLTKKEIISHISFPSIFLIYFSIIWIYTLFEEPDDKAIIAKDLGYFTIQALHDSTLFLYGIGYPIGCFVIIRKAQIIGISKEQTKFIVWIRSLIALLAIGVFLEMTAVLLGRIYGYWQSNPVDERLGFSFTLMVKVYNAVVLYAISLRAYNSYSSFRQKNKSVFDNESNILGRIQREMEIEKLHLNTELSLGKFSSHLGITSVRLSDILNNVIGTSFNDFVNKYRVEEVIRIVEEGKSKHLTFEAISEKAGFKSKTTFYRAFKKVTGKTPKAYFNSHLHKE